MTSPQKRGRSRSSKDQRLFSLNAEQYDAFIQILNNPPSPGPKLKALMRRTPAWAATPKDEGQLIRPTDAAVGTLT